MAEQTTQRRITRVRLDGFRGHRLDVPVAPLTVLTGPNMTGKTSVLDGVSLALSGRVPGAPTDETGMTSCEALEDCTPASQRFTVEVEDDAGETARFEVSIGDKKTTRNVVASFADGRKNDWHRKAILERFGTGGGVAGLVSLDLEALRALAPAELERLVMRLCGDAHPAEWTTERLLSILAARTMTAAGGETTDAAWGGVTPANLQEYMAEQETGRDDASTIGAMTDVREVLAVLRDKIESWRSEADSGVRRLKAAAEAEVPEAPSPSEVAELQERRDEQQRAVEERATEVGRLEGEQRAERAAIERRRKELDAAIEAARREYAGARREVEGLAQRDLQAEVAAAETVIAEAEAEVERLTAVATAGVELPRTFAEAIERIGARVAELQAAEHEPVDALEKAMDAAEVQLDAARTATATARAAEADAKAALEHALERARCVAAGKCPTCEQDTESVHHVRQDEAEAAQVAFDVAKAALEAATRHEQDARARLTEASGRLRKARDHERDLEAARSAAKDAEQAAAAARSGIESDRQRDLALAVQQRANARQRLEDLQKSAETHDTTLAAARERQGAAEARGQELAQQVRELTVVGEVEAAAAAAVRAASAALADAKAELDAATKTFESAKSRRDEADRVLAAREEAAAQRATARAQAAFWRVARTELVKLEREVLADFVAPLVQPVNALLEMADAVSLYGRFAARFGTRFALGFEQADGSFAPLSQLSDGHFAVAMALIVTSIHSLVGGPYRALSIDRAEALDHATRGPLLDILTWLLAEGHLDQVLLGAVDAYTWSELAEGVTVVDLRDCMGVAQDSKQSKEAAAAAAA